jgi:hypothetical protein
MIPASYLFKSLYQDRYERELPPEQGRSVEMPPQDGLRGSRHPAVPYIFLLGVFGLMR